LKRVRREGFKEIPGSINLLERLKEDFGDLKFGLLSSNPKEWIEFLRDKFNHERHFDAVLYSYQKGFIKPAEEILGFTEFNKVNEYFGEEIKELLDQNPADIVHIHDFQLLFAYKYVPRGTPLIMTWHIPFIENMSKNLSAFLVKHLNEFDKVVFSSEEYIKAAVKAGLPKEKTELIYPIANTDIFKYLDVDKEAVKKKYKIPANSKVILCVQRIDSKSGHEQLIKAMPRILKKVTNAKLVFVGSKSMSNKLSKDREILAKNVKHLVKKLRLQKDIIFTGNIDYNLLPDLYNSVDVVALCSKNEGFGLSVTEGMACGNPIIGTKVGGIPIQVKNGKNGFLVGVGNVKATADKIIEILSNEKLRKKMSKNSLKIVDRKFRTELGIEKQLILYNEVKKYKDELHNIEHLNLSDIKAIVTDLDRTLTDTPPKQKFDPNDFDAEILKALKNLKIDLILATGRNIRYVKRLCKNFNIWKCIIAENGAVLYFPSTKKTISTNTAHMKKAKKMIKELNISKKVIGKIIVSINNKSVPLVKEKLGKLSERVKFVRNVNETMIIPLDVDKGNGLQLAMQYLNIDMEKTIIIGDGENDVDMFLNPGFKIALANANKKLKKLANQVTEKCSTSGIKEIIEKLKMQK